MAKVFNDNIIEILRKNPELRHHNNTNRSPGSTYLVQYRNRGGSGSYNKPAGSKTTASKASQASEKIKSAESFEIRIVAPPLIESPNKSDNKQNDSKKSDTKPNESKKSDNNQNEIPKKDNKKTNNNENDVKKMPKQIKKSETKLKEIKEADTKSNEIKNSPSITKVCDSNALECRIVQNPNKTSTVSHDSITPVTAVIAKQCKMEKMDCKKRKSLKEQSTDLPEKEPLACNIQPIIMPAQPPIKSSIHEIYPAPATDKSENEKRQSMSISKSEILSIYESDVISLDETKTDKQNITFLRGILGPYPDEPIMSGIDKIITVVADFFGYNLNQNEFEVTSNVVSPGKLSTNTINDYIKKEQFKAAHHSRYKH